MMKLFGQWLTKWEAREAWGGGQAPVSQSVVDQVSERYAPHWAKWVHELVLTDPRKFSPRSEHLFRITHADFWTQCMQRLSPNNERFAYWKELLEQACMEGNLSVVQGFAAVEGGPKAAQAVDACRWLHPRIVSWQMEQGVISKKHINDLYSTMDWPSKFTAYDAQHAVFGGPAARTWVGSMLQWPVNTMAQHDSYRLARLMQQWLERAEVPPAPRDAQGLSCISRAGRYRDIRPWYHASDLEPTLHADEALAMFNDVCQRFGLDNKLMDAISGRWTAADLDDPRVCAVIDFLYHSNVKTGIGWRMFSEYISDPGHEMHGISKVARDEPVLCSALALMADPSDAWSVYQTAIRFFQPAGPELEVPALRNIDSELFM